MPDAVFQVCFTTMFHLGKWVWRWTEFAPEDFKQGFCQPEVPDRTSFF